MKELRARRFSPLWWVTLPVHMRTAYRRLTLPDPALSAASYWWHGRLPRRRIEELACSADNSAITIVNPCLRDPGTSVTLFELNCILLLMKMAGATNVIEIGTYDGNTTLNMAANLPKDAKIVTIDLPLDAEAKDLSLEVDNDKELNLTDRQIVGKQFLGDPNRSKIRQVFADSGELDFSSLAGPFDFAFIDGCHAYNYVKSDTNNILKVMRPGGMVVWHDYAMMESVSQAVDEYAGILSSLCCIESTRLAVGIS